MVVSQQKGWAANTRHSFAVLDDDGLAGCVVLKRGREIGYWTAAHARGRDVASRAVRALATWARGEGASTLEIRHQVGNEASCRVAEKAGFPLRETLPATPPWPLPGHVHVRDRPAGNPWRTSDLAWPPATSRRHPLPSPCQLALA
ncbi:GNAT family N-acetyltransferase [Actinophytocola sp. KF-1]